jgi:hypothetical protein
MHEFDVIESADRLCTLDAGSISERLRPSAFDAALEMGRDKLDLVTRELGLLIADVI